MTVTRHARTRYACSICVPRLSTTKTNRCCRLSAVIFSIVPSMVSGRAPTVPVEDSQTPLDDPRWAFGKVFLERRQHCDACNSPVYELVQCGECGAEYLSALEVMERMPTGCNHACTIKMRTSSSRNWSL